MTTIPDRQTRTFLTLILNNIYICKVFRWKHLRCHAAILSPLLALGTLNDATQIGSFLFLPHHPRWPRQVVETELPCGIARVFPKKLCKCKCALRNISPLYNWSFLGKGDGGVKLDQFYRFIYNLKPSLTKRFFKNRQQIFQNSFFFQNYFCGCDGDDTPAFNQSK